MTPLLVGREHECAALRAHLASSGGVILVSGEAGVGKTTFVEHVLAGTTAWRGQAGEWAGTAYDILARALRSLAAADDVLAQLRPESVAVVGSVLTGAAAGRPAVLFLDDLQWADNASLDLLPALADVLSGSTVAVVGCYRSDELPRDHRLRVVRALLRFLLGAVPQRALVAAVATRSDGLPFAVEELAFALRDGGHMSYRNGMVGLAAGEDMAVPDGIREAVLLRTSRLTDEGRTLVEAASVAGQEFDVDVVLAVAGAAAWPDGFTGAGLFAEASEGKAAFRHALNREAVYADIPWPRRHRLHRALAAALEADGASAGLIAAHLLAAREFAEARPALIAAADEHYAAHAYRDAARALRTALAHWGPDRIADRLDLIGPLDVIDRLARCAEMCSEYTEAGALLSDLAERHEQHGDIRALADTRRRQALVQELCGQWESALASREAAATAYSAAGLPAEAAIDRLAVAAHQRSAATFSAAMETLAVADTDATASGRLDLQLRVRGLRGNVLARLGRASEGLAELRSALDHALTAPLPDTAAELQQRLADSLEHVVLRYCRRPVPS
jgi:tetratricopeptide (TPR) repeat protein